MDRQARDQFPEREEGAREAPRRAYSDAQIEEIIDRGPRNSHEEAIERSYWIGNSHGEHRGYNKRKKEGDHFPIADVIMEFIRWAGVIAVVLIIAYVVLRIVGMVPSIFA